jgi:hypothetical protein
MLEKKEAPSRPSPKGKEKEKEDKWQNLITTI